MNTLLLLLIIILTNILLGPAIKKIISQNKLNNDFVFIYLSNVILMIAFLLFYVYLNILSFSFYIAFFQMIFAFLLIFNLKNILGKYQIISLPYFFLWIYVFAKIFILYLF